MIKVNIIADDYDEIESIDVKGEMFEVFTMIDKTSFLTCGTDRVRCEKVELLSIDFRTNSIDVMVIDNNNVENFKDN